MKVWKLIRPGMPLVLLILLVILLGARGSSRSEFTGLPQSFADLVEMVSPAVVNISTTTVVKVHGNLPGESPQPDPDATSDREMKLQSLGSGIIVSRDGLIITNNHMAQGTGEVKVVISDGRELRAKVVGRDPKTDLALLKISSFSEELPMLTLGDSEKVRVGDWVLAVGNPFGLEHTVTQGIISATGRVLGSGPYDNYLQTDAPFNPGSSGGPLVNLKGEVIGINTAIVTGAQGIGFAIPSSLVKSVIDQLKEKGRVVRGSIGVSTRSVTPEIAGSFGLKVPHGALVVAVVPIGPADRGGIRRGDIIAAIGGHQVRTGNDLLRLVAETPVGKSIALIVIRDGKEVPATLQVEELTE
jgi:serine protease Do